MRVAYLVNQYPKVSHSFIRREIRALERAGVEVQRIALRGWDGELADGEDRDERARTRYVLEAGIWPLLSATVRFLLLSPARFFRALALALRMSRRAERPLPYHLAYLAEACRIVPWLDACGAKHLHAHFGTNAAEIAALASVLGAPPYSFTVHGQEELLGGGGMRDKAERAAFVVAISSYGRSQLFRWIERGQWSKVKVVHCGLERSFFDAAPAAPPTAPRLVCVGRLSDEKGQLLLVEAIHDLAKRGVSIELVLAGDGENRPEVERLIARYDLASRIRITGWVSGERVREEVLAARALVLPSFAEGLPVVIMEAMALRRPVIATWVAGIPELVRPGENGWLVPAGSVDELAAALEDCVTRPVAEVQKMGDAGYRRALARHSVDVEAAKLARLFRDSAS